MVDKERVKENAKQATKWILVKLGRGVLATLGWTLSKLWKGTVATCRYLWGGTKMVVEDLYRKIAKKEPKKRGLKARLKQAAAVTAAVGGLIFGGEKAVQNYQTKYVRSHKAYKEFSNTMDYLYQKHGYPIDPKSSVWNTSSNKGVFKLSQQELKDRQRFLTYVSGYLKKFAYFNTSFDSDKLSKPLSVQQQQAVMVDFMGFDLVEKGRLAQKDPSALKDYQICAKACNEACAIITKAQKEKSEYACFDRVKMEIERLKTMQEDTSKLQESSSNTNSAAHARSGERLN